MKLFKRYQPKHRKVIGTTAFAFEQAMRTDLDTSDVRTNDHDTMHTAKIAAAIGAF